LARLESIAVGGYYPTPQAVLDILAGYIHFGKSPTMADPCAGEGDAIHFLASRASSPNLYLCEMEASRYAVLKARPNSWRALHGDFFCVTWKGGNGVDFLYLNPPYDTDKVHGRLEEKFLERCVPLLRIGGWMAFVVPYYALKASVKTLTQNFHSISCFRFPDSEWDAYKQVVLFASRCDYIEHSQPHQEQLILDWVNHPENIPVLDHISSPIIHVTTGGWIGNWDVKDLDYRTLGKQYRLWASSPGMHPPDDIHEHFRKVFPVASPPRAAHLAGALSAGVFNGMHVHPDDPTTGLPDLLIKGVFDKEYRKVEDKTNKDGEVVAELQVQQPKLRVCIMDLTTGMHHDIKTDDSIQSELDISSMSMRDLLQRYGKSLMRGMLAACPVLQDNPDIPDTVMPVLYRQPFPAQMDAIQTLTKLHRLYPNRGTVVLGEIGAGKTTVALTTAYAMGKKKVLVVCPPHLLESWRGESAVVLPHAKFLILKTISDVREFMAHSGEMCVAVLSRESAKLGHKWASVASKRCPACGHDIAARDYAVKRETCGHTSRTPANAVASWLKSNYPRFQPYLGDFFLNEVVGSRTLSHLSSMRDTPISSDLEEVLMGLLDIQPELAPAVAWAIPNRGLEILRKIKDEEVFIKTAVGVRDWDRTTNLSQTRTWDWSELRSTHKRIWEDGMPWTGYGTFSEYRITSDGLKRHHYPAGGRDALVRLMHEITTTSKFHKHICHEPLYYAVPEPRRYPLATWIQRYASDAYDMLVVDESHEYASENSAQTHSVQRLMQTKSASIMHLTGSFMNGYADSVFMNMWALSPEFRADFGRDDLTAFIDRFGYWKRIVDVKEQDTSRIEYGSHSERIVKGARKAGVAPGILPLFVLRHLLPMSVTLQKEDLKLGIPPRADYVEVVDPGRDLAFNFGTLKADLVAEIKRTKFMPGLAGKLWGAMARLPHYMDLACTGNGDGSGWFEIRWPANVPDATLAGSVVTSVPLLPENTILPKEQWLIDRVQEEVDSGRNVIVFPYHTVLMERYTRILSSSGFHTVMLDASAVPAGKRLDWITKNVVKKKAEVLVVNPVAVQTGLNNLVHFSTQIWMENPMCNPIVYRQACGRVDRIGQKKNTSIFFPLYEGIQESAHSLLLHKVGVSTAVDGLDPEEALRAAGVMDSAFADFSVGKMLYEMIKSED
jgi:hypothetical protein